jgi:hypothetical protein
MVRGGVISTAKLPKSRLVQLWIQCVTIRQQFFGSPTIGMDRLQSAGWLVLAAHGRAVR